MEAEGQVARHDGGEFATRFLVPVKVTNRFGVHARGALAERESPRQ
jgi:hypothetical protein